MFGTCAYAETKESRPLFRIYIDADQTHNKASGLSIKRGIKTALAENLDENTPYKIEVLSLDHRGNSVRSKRHLNQYKEDAQALVVFGGLHSPPLINNKEYINKNKILTLVPWAAAGPITRSKTKENWIYRASIDDTKAGYVIVKHAIKKESCTAPHLLLEETPWGRSNQKTMLKALEKYKVQPSGVTWFGWHLKAQGARTHLRQIIEKGADCILLVANAPEGITFAKALLSLPQKEDMKIMSHWGITGGKFAHEINAEMRGSLNLSFIQSCFSFISSPETNVSKKAFKTAQSLYPEEIKTPLDIKAPAGFIHGYDLTKILITALNHISLSGNIKDVRQALKDELENLSEPVEGLVKTYKKPFSSSNEKENFDAHEALNVNDFCMAHYGDNDEIIVFNSKNNSREKN